jgi:predicted Rossmann-fold nucleotide-binding protein
MNALNTPINIGGSPLPSLDEAIDGIIARFKAETGAQMIIAFSGGADSGLGSKASASVKSFFEEQMHSEIKAATEYLRDYRIAVLSGGTNTGVPAVAAKCAKEAGIPTIGVYPKCGERYALPDPYVDLRICVEPLFGPSVWGDESPVFAKLLDGVIVYGGGAGTLIEAAHILKCNESLIKKGRLKFIVPIRGSGGTADFLPYFPSKVEVRAACMPPAAISSGYGAAEWLEFQLNLFEDYRQK